MLLKIDTQNERSEFCGLILSHSNSFENQSTQSIDFNTSNYLIHNKKIQYAHLQERIIS